jgi:hypothetical protein
METRVVDVQMKIRCTVPHNTDTCYTINTHEVVNKIYNIRLNSRAELIRTLVLTKLIFVSFLVHHFCSELVSDCTSTYDFQQAVENEMFLEISKEQAIVTRFKKQNPQ